MEKWITGTMQAEGTGFTGAQTQHGQKSYELSNHLGNVMAVISDRGVLQSAQDYFPFGMAMPGRSTGAYRYTFNGKETDPETGIQDYGMRWYLPNIARFPSVDPLTKKYPFYTPYAFAGNTPIRAIDLDGAETLEQVGVFPVYGQIECSIIRKRSNGFRGVAEGHISIELDDRREFALWRGRMTNGTTVLSLRTDFDVNTDAGIPNPNDPTQLNKLSYTDAAKKLGITLNPTEEVHFAVPGTDDSGIGNQLYRGGVDLGDLGVAFKMGANGNIEACAIGIITDHGPAKMTGEGSPKANSTLGLPTHHFKGGSSTNNINMHLFAGSAKYWKKHIGGKDADGKPLTNQQIYEAGFNDMMKEMIDSSDPKLNSMLLKLNKELNKEKTYKEYDNIPPTNK